MEDALIEAKKEIALVQTKCDELENTNEQVSSLYRIHCSEIQ